MERFDNKRSNGPRNSFRSGGPRNSFRPREMHKAVCDKCKKKCEVPFKPTQGKPVYCNDCHVKKKPRF